MKVLIWAILAAAFAGCLADEGTHAEPPVASLHEQAVTGESGGGPTVLGCGNFQCEGGETPENCPSDYSVCGDSVCYPHERNGYCPQDCCMTTLEECGG